MTEDTLRFAVAVDGIDHQLERLVLAQVEPHETRPSGAEHQRVHPFHPVDLLRAAGATHQVVSASEISMDLQAMVVTTDVERRNQRSRRPVHRRHRTRIPRVRGIGARYAELS
ncbi:MAG: hypothetical protein E4H03_08260 [Myxococcales bacterium]|jgi:hypothetical protein|nr:MAG: hypothetical protein E4H03_08260 [Myxococcales bacterium]